MRFIVSRSGSSSGYGSTTSTSGGAAARSDRRFSRSRRCWSLVNVTFFKSSERKMTSRTRPGTRQRIRLHQRRFVLPNPVGRVGYRIGVRPLKGPDTVLLHPLQTRIWTVAPALLRDGSAIDHDDVGREVIAT